MKELHLPDNIKVHFAGAEVQNHFEAAKIMGVSYYLYTCFPWVSKMVFGKGLGLLWAPGGLKTLFGLIAGQYLLKLCLAVIDTPFFYMFTRGADKINPAHQEA